VRNDSGAPHWQHPFGSTPPWPIGPIPRGGLAVVARAHKCSRSIVSILFFLNLTVANLYRRLSRNPVPFGGTITHHRMPLNTMAAHVAYFWRGKDKPTFWVYIGGMTHRRASHTGVHLLQACISYRRTSYRRASYRRASLRRASYRRASQACIL
jgi:hypothetical protein